MWQMISEGVVCCSPPCIMMKRFQNSLWFPVVVLFAIALLSRIPFQSQILYEWDSVNFALALEKFDVRLHQPHPPGTFVFYIFLGRFFNLFFQNANTSLVAVSILATGIAAVALFVLSSQWFNRRVGWITSLLMLSSPLVWFYGEVALSYMLEFAWVLLLVLACFRTRFGDSKAFFTAAFLLGLAGGIRPNTPFFLFPLWSIAVALGMRDRKYTWKHLVSAVILILLGVMAWAIPMITMSGGFAAYQQAIDLWLDRHLKDADQIWEVINNAISLLQTLLIGVGFAIVPLLVVLWQRKGQFLRKLQQDWRVQTLVLWMIPGAVYLTFIHFQRQGHSFTIIPAFVVIAGFGLSVVANQFAQVSRAAGVALISLVLISNSLFFIFGPAEPNIWRTWTNIHQYDTLVSERLQAIRQHFNPQETIVLARSRNGRLPNFYLRDYQETSLSYQLPETPILLPSQVQNLVLFDQRMFVNLPVDPGFQTLILPRGDRLRYLTWKPQQTVQISKTTLKVQ